MAPLLRHVDQTELYANYHAKVDDWGYHRSCEEYDWLLSQRIKGLCQVPVVHSTYLMRRDVIPKLSYDDGSGRHEYVMFSDSARKKASHSTSTIVRFMDTWRRTKMPTLPCACLARRLPRRPRIVPRKQSLHRP